jgi:serine/threonine protein kinase
VSSVLDLSEGAIFAQQFKVVRPLAKGGMGAVYVVEQLGTKRERALKLMHPMLVSDERSRERFEREAQVASRIESDHVVEVIAAGVEPHTHTPWLCMELLKGEELGARMTRGPLRADEVLEVARQLGHALGAAHKAGIVHRDLKPENLFLATPRREGIPFTLKVLDFGVAALVHEASGKSTATQGVGSPLWMAPEQTNIGNVRPATDVWAVGLLAYHFLTGTFYWKAASTEGSTLTALLVEVMVEPLVPASVRAAEQGRGAMIPRGFDAWFSRCVDRNPDHRFPEAGAAIAELVAVLTGNTPSLAPGTQPQAFAATMAVSTSPLGGASGPAPASIPAAYPATAPSPLPTANMAAPAPMTMPAHPAALPSPVAPASSGSRWPLVIGSLLFGLLLCGAGLVYSLYRGAEAIAANVASPHLEVDGEHGEHVSVTSEGVVVTMPDGGVLVATGAPGIVSDPATIVGVVADEETEEAGETEAEGAAEPEDDEAEADEAEADEPETRVRRPRVRAAGRASPMARALRARLQRCVQGNLVGEPTAQWTFTLNFNTFGTANGARIVGPHAGEPGGAYGTFRRCVQSDVAGFDSGGDPGPFTLMLP